MSTQTQSETKQPMELKEAIPADLKEKGWKLFMRESTAPFIAEHDEWDLSTGGYPAIDDAINKARDMTVEEEEARAIQTDGERPQRRVVETPEETVEANAPHEPEPPAAELPAAEVPFALTPPPAQPVIRILKLDNIRIDGGTQPRSELSLETVERYAEAKREGAEFPPGVVFDDGSDLWLGGGFHRFFADRKNGATEAAFEVRQGTLRDAILFSVGENATHGLPRSNEDKRRAVLILLKDEEWSPWSDTLLAQKANVSQAFVSKMRRELASQNVLSEQSTLRKGRDGIVRETANIGVRHEDDDRQPLLTDVGGAHEAEEASLVRRCRRCQCTDAQACEGGCTWVEDDLCSACQTEETEASEPAEPQFGEDSTDIVQLLNRHGGVLYRGQLEDMGVTFGGILNALGEGAIVQLEPGKFGLPDHKPQPSVASTTTSPTSTTSRTSPADSVTPSESAAPETSSAASSSATPSAATSSTPAAKPKPSIDEILKGRGLTVSFGWLPGLKGKVQVTVNATNKPEKASRKLIDSEKVRGFADDIQQMIVEQLNGHKMPATEPVKKAASTKKAAPAKKAPPKKTPANKSAAKRSAPKKSSADRTRALKNQRASKGKAKGRKR